MVFIENQQEVMGFSKNHYWTHKIQDGGHPLSWKSWKRHEKLSDFDEIWYKTADDSDVTIYENV